MLVIAQRPTYDEDSLWQLIQDCLKNSLPIFRHLVQRCAKNQLYLQGVQFTHNLSETQPGKSEEVVTPEEWVQANFYQAFLTMKASVLLEVNPRPVVRPSHTAHAGDGMSILAVRQAIDAILREVNIDHVINSEIWALLLYGTSFRVTYCKFRERPSICPVCSVEAAEGNCLVCGLSVESGADGEIVTEVVDPSRVIVYPPFANSLADVLVLAWVDVVPRHTAISRLTRIWALDQPTIEQAIEKVYQTGYQHEESESPSEAAIAELDDVYRIVRNMLHVSQDINRVGTRGPTSDSAGSVPLIPIATIIVRKNALAHLDHDLALHFIEKQCIGATRTSLDDVFALFRNRTVHNRFYGDSEEALREQQDALNNLLTISYISAMSRSFSVIAGDPQRVNLDNVPRFPNSIITEVSTAPEQDVKSALEIVPGTPITPDVPQLRDSILSNMQILAQTFPILFGQLPAGVEAYKAIEVLRSQSLRAMRSFIASWAASHAQWLHQALKLARSHWFSARVTDIGGYTFHVEGRLIPDPESVSFDLQPHVIFPAGESDRRSQILQGLQLGLVDLADPVIKAKVLTELGLDFLDEPSVSEIDRQRNEINSMIATGEFIPTDPYDRHQVHYKVVLNFLRSEYGVYLRKHKSHVYRLIEAHGKIHAFLAVGDYQRAAIEMSKVGIREWMQEKSHYTDAEDLARRLREIAQRERERSATERQQVQQATDELAQEQALRQTLEAMQSGIAAGVPPSAPPPESPVIPTLG